MSVRYLFVDELGFISDRLLHVFDRHADGAATQVSFKDVQQFQRQIRTWDRRFIRPPMSLIATCNLEMLSDFYRKKLDTSIFQEFNPADLAVIQEEISAYAAREALDAFIGYRLRNLAAIGLQPIKWPEYQELVAAYYTRTISQEKRDRIAAFEQMLVETTDQAQAEIHAQCVGELFFEVDEIRLMSPRRLERHLENIHQHAMGRKIRNAGKHLSVHVPDMLRNSFQLFGFTHQVDFDILKDRYRQLALSYHPDKGGSLEMMQKLNTAYRQIADYLRQNQ